MPTIACYMHLLRPGQQTQAYRRVLLHELHVVEGAGYSMVGGQRLDWEDKDVFTVPTWTFHEHIIDRRPPGLLVQLQRRAGNEGLEPLPRRE